MEEEREVSVVLPVRAVLLLHKMLFEDYKNKLNDMMLAKYVCSTLLGEECDIPGEGHDGSPREKIEKIREIRTTMRLLWKACEQFDKAIEELKADE